MHSALFFVVAFMKIYWQEFERSRKYNSLCYDWYLCSRIPSGTLTWIGLEWLQVTWCDPLLSLITWRPKPAIDGRADGLPGVQDSLLQTAACSLTENIFYVEPPGHRCMHCSRTRCNLYTQAYRPSPYLYNIQPMIINNDILLFTHIGKTRI